jgi:hypothetical protein
VKPSTTPLFEEALPPVQPFGIADEHAIDWRRFCRRGWLLALLVLIPVSAWQVVRYDAVLRHEERVRREVADEMLVPLPRGGKLLDGWYSRDTLSRSGTLARFALVPGEYAELEDYLRRHASSLHPQRLDSPAAQRLGWQLERVRRYRMAEYRGQLILLDETRPDRPTVYIYRP